MFSDYPFPLGEQSPGELILNNTTFSENDKAKLLGLNAIKFFGSRINKERWLSDTKLL